MVKRMAISILLDLLVAGCLISVLLPRSDVTKNCSIDLYNTGLAICAYNVFFVVRNLIICASCYLSENPVTNTTISRGAFVFVDCALYTYVSVWATQNMLRDSVMECKDKDENISQFFWSVLCLIIVGYLQLFVEWILCLVTSCIFCIFCCFYFGQRRQDRATALERFREHAPMMARAKESISKQKYKDLSSKVK